MLFKANFINFNIYEALGIDLQGLRENSLQNYLPALFAITLVSAEA